MENQIISLKVAKLAKEKKFYNYCIYSYWQEELRNMTPGYDEEPGRIKTYKRYPRYYAPEQNLLQRWLREVHNIHIALNKNDLNWNYQLFDLTKCDEEYNSLTESYAGYKSYEEALENGLYNGLQLIK